MSKEETKKESKIRKVLFKDQRAKLPLGIKTSNGAYDREIVAKRWNMKQEKLLGELKEQNKSVGIGHYVSMILATMLEKLGPWDFEKMKFNEKLLKISQMYAGDVLYAYCYLRSTSLGNTIGMNLSCPACGGEEFEFDADMSELEVVCGETIEDFFWEYELIEKIEFRGAEIKGFKFGPSRWNSYETITNDPSGGEGLIKAKMIANSIVSVIGEDKPVIIAENEIDEMGKRDIEGITRQIDKNRLGPEMVIESVCPKKHTSLKPIVWSYESFFESSSR